MTQFCATCGDPERCHVQGIGACELCPQATDGRTPCMQFVARKFEQTVTPKQVAALLFEMVKPAPEHWSIQWADRAGRFTAKVVITLLFLFVARMAVKYAPSADIRDACLIITGVGFAGIWIKKE